nr:hypothetical protein [uncultured Psychrobacter sp.]
MAIEQTATDIVQELADFRVDMQDFRNFLFEHADVMVPRRLEPDTYSLQHYLAYLDAIKLVFTQETGDVTVGGKTIAALSQQIDAAVATILKSGGHVGYSTLAAADADKANITAKTVVEITNDTDAKNGIYLYDGTDFTKSAYDVVAIAKIYTNQQKTVVKNYADDELSTTNRAVVKTSALAQNKVANPAIIFGDKLLNYYDHQSAWFNASGAPAQTAVTRILGIGKYPEIVTNSDIYKFIGASAKPQYLYLARRSSSADPVDITYNANVISSIKAAKSFTFYAMGDVNPLNAGSHVFFNTGKERLTVYAYAGTDKASFVLDTFDGTNWIEHTVWEAPLSTLDQGADTLPLVSDKVTSIEFYSDKITQEFRVAINNKEAVKKTGAKEFFEFEGTVFISSYHHKKGAAAVAAILVDSYFGAGLKIWDYISRPLYFLPSGIRQDSYKTAFLGRDYSYDNLPARPVTLAGAYNIANAEYLKQEFTTSGVVIDMPELSVPVAPNVAPFDEPHDRFKLDATVTRLCPMPHPDAPTDSTKLIMMANATYYASNNSKYNYMLAYESNDGGANFTRIANPNPPAGFPPECTSTINNIVVNSQVGRYFYIGDTHPNGYTPHGMTAAFKYFYLSETTRRLYGCTDILDYSTYEIIYINKHSYPAYDGSTINYSVLSESTMTAPDGNESMSRTEEKIAGYDKTTNRFYRISKVTKPAMDYFARATNLENAMVRHLVISWSEVGDITRWGAYQEFIPARTGHHQSYDLDVIKVRDDYWAVLVFTYAEIENASLSAEFNTETDQNLRMRVDLYVSRDQLRTPPVIMRETWLDNNEQQWASGTLWAFGHPFDKSKIYVNGGEGKHGGIIDGQTQRDIRWKVAITDFPFSISHKPDKTITTGTLRSRFMDGSEVDKLRVISTNGYTAVRVLNAQGAVVVGMDYSDYAVVNANNIVTWNGLKRLPHGIVQLEIRLDNAEFNGVYPMRELYRKY